MRKISWIYSLLLLSLNSSCTEMIHSKEHVNETSLIDSTLAVSLNFKSGIRAIFQDSKGNYWFGSHDEGVAIFNGKSVEYITVDEGLAENNIRSIQEDQNGSIWIETARGASVYENGIIKTYLSKSQNPINKWNETQGDLWFYAGEEGGVYRFDGKQMNYLEFPVPIKVNADNTFGLTSVSKATNGKIWFATYAALFSYDGKDVSVFDEGNLNLKKQDLLHIRSVLADSKGRIWIGNNGIGVLLMEGNSTINFSEKHALIHPSSSRRGDQSKPGTMEHVFVIKEDADGNIWFGDRDNGAWKYDGKTLTNYTVDEALNSQMIWCIYEDQQKNLLFGMEAGGIYQFNGKTFDKRF